MAYLNSFSQSTDELDLSHSEEFYSLQRSADELHLEYRSDVRYVSRNVVLNGLRFHFLEWGDPRLPALVLLHGGNQSAHSWDLVSLVLSPKAHVVALDQRGHGDTEWPRDGARTLHHMANDVTALISALSLHQPLVIGHSMGGLVAMTMLLEDPNVARKAILVDVGPELSERGRRIVGDFLRSLGEFASVDDFVDRVSAYDPYRPKGHIQRTVKYNLMQRHDGLFVSKHDHRRHGSRHDRIASAGPTLDDCRKLNVPILVLRGGNSDVLTVEAAAQFVEALPQGTLITVPDCGHNVHSQNTRGFLASIQDWI